MADQIIDQDPVKERCFICGKAVQNEDAGIADDDVWFLCNECRERISRKIYDDVEYCIRTHAENHRIP